MPKVTNLETAYNDIILALKGISLEVPQGKIVAHHGAAGAEVQIKQCRNRYQGLFAAALSPFHSGTATVIILTILYKGGSI
jgi:ABC-type Na+ transport system ATPase subunit NatA